MSDPDLIAEMREFILYEADHAPGCVGGIESNHPEGHWPCKCGLLDLRERLTVTPETDNGE